MKSKLLYKLTLLFAAVSGICQEDMLFKGRVITPGKAGLAAVFVINKSDGKETKTTADGSFTIMAKPGDMLAVYGKDVEVRNFLLRQEAFKIQPYELSVNYQPYEMDEVVIDKNINSESLGLVPKNQKKFTQQEKKLYTASYNTPLWKLALGLLAGSMPVDPFINAITGRTRMLKTTIVIEKNSSTIEKLNGIYTAGEIESLFKVPAEYVKGFIVYAAESPEINNAFTAGDEGHVKLLLGSLAERYNQLLTNE